MKKVVKKQSRAIPILLTIAAVIFVIFVLLPVTFALFDGDKMGNVAIIPIEGIITANGASYLGGNTISSQDIVSFIEDADAKSQIKIIVLEINSPGGSPVASDEIAVAIKRTEKPVIALIREVGASGGYWIASATDHIIANRMSITGSIGVISSYLEFSGLMEEYGVGYEQLTAGQFKDMGTPFKKLQDEERKIIQRKIDALHDFFIDEISQNRNLARDHVIELATGEFYLGVEALSMGLVDQLGDKHTAETYMKERYDIENVDYVTYQQDVGILDILTSVFSQFSFHVGRGFNSLMVEQQQSVMLL